MFKINAENHDYNTRNALNLNILITNLIAEQISAKILHFVIQATDLAHMFMLDHLVQKQR